MPPVAATRPRHASLDFLFNRHTLPNGCDACVTFSLPRSGQVADSRQPQTGRDDVAPRTESPEGSQ